MQVHSYGIITICTVKYQSIPDVFSAGQRYQTNQSSFVVGSSTNQPSAELYADELEGLQKILPYPEEVAMSLTETEYKLFNGIPGMYYVRHVTMDLSRSPTTSTDHNNTSVATLIQRFYEVRVANF